MRITIELDSEDQLSEFISKMESGFPGLFSTATVKSSKKPVAPLLKDKEKLDAAMQVIEYRRTLLRMTYAYDESSIISKSAVTDARRILSLWPSEWKSIISMYVEINDEWHRRTHWPLASLIKYADRYDSQWKNKNNLFSRTSTSIVSEADEYEKMLQARAMAAERL